MEMTQTDQAEIKVYDLNELSTFTDFPAKIARLAIQEFIDPVFHDDNDLDSIYLGVGEIVKDVEVHGDELSPRLIIVKRELGGVAIDTVNKIKENSESNGFGRVIIDRVFGDSYDSRIEDGTYKGHLFIHADSTGRQYSQNHNAA